MSAALDIPPGLTRALDVITRPDVPFTESLRAFGLDVQRIAREEYLRGPRPGRVATRSGGLSRSVAVDESGLPNEVDIGTAKLAGKVLEYGATIVAKHGKWLLFRGGAEGRGRWVRVHSVRIRATPWLAPSVEQASALGSERMAAAFNKAIGS